MICFWMVSGILVDLELEVFERVIFWSCEGREDGSFDGDRCPENDQRCEYHRRKRHIKAYDIQLIRHFNEIHIDGMVK